MSIAITAPQKFAFQDLVCLEIMLRFCGHDDATLLVEPDSGEDAKLRFTAYGRPVRCEIQVKGATVDTAELITLLRERRAAILAEHEVIEQAMKQPDPQIDGWIDP